MADPSSSFQSYDVFLSFRGEDTRNNFTAHLHKELLTKGIDTFIDEERLETGLVIHPALVAAIENSKFSIIVLSENYASSRWCLEELVKILECKRTRGQRVLPIFYNVDPSDVRKHRGKFGEALAKHEENLENMEWMRIWRDALTGVANLKGWDTRNKNEATLIEEIASSIFHQKMNMAQSDGAEDLVGIDSRVCEIEPLLCLKTADVRIIGIWGMSGIGKTTLADAIFERFRNQFEGCVFFANVGKKLEREGIEGLQEKLLSKILGLKNLSLRGRPSIKIALGSKKVLIVLDNVKDPMIIEKIAKKRDWFGVGSRIIITTTNKNVLRTNEVKEIYEVKKFDGDEAMKLFGRCVFKQDHPRKDFVELSKSIIACTHGLPLAIEVLGRLLINKCKYEWETKLDTLTMDLKLGIQNVLQMSYNELNEDERCIFLDIACFYEGEDRDYVAEILDSRNCRTIERIHALVDKSLITISGNKLQMHDLLQEMGREVVHQESKEPGKRTRLWMHDDISHVLKNNKGTEEIIGISLDLSHVKETLRLTTPAFARMNKLELLKVYNSAGASKMGNCNVHFSEGFKFHSDALRCLHLLGYNLKSLPNDFNAENLVHLSMPHSHVQQLWKGSKVMKELKSIDLSHSTHLTETPNFSGVVNLEQLILQGCISLRRLHPSIGVLNKLKLLNLRNCKMLKSLPEGVGNLTSLQLFYLSGCRKLENFPNNLGKLQMLKELYADETAVTELPSSMGFLKNLEIFSFQGHKGPSPARYSMLRTSSNSMGFRLRHLSGLSSLLKLNLSDRNISDGAGLSNLGLLSSLEILILNGNNFNTLPGCISQLSQLRWLELKNCKTLQKLPELPSSIEYIGAHNCTSLEAVSNQSLYSSLMIAKLKEHPRRTSQLEPFAAFTVVVPGSEIPYWICSQSSGREVTVKLPPNWFNTHFLAFASCVVTSGSVLPYADSINGLCTKCTLFYSTSSRVPSSCDVFPRRHTEGRMELDHVWLSYVRFPISINWHEVTQIKFSFEMILGTSSAIKRCGVGQVYGNDDENYNNPDMIQFNSIFSPNLEEIHDGEPSGSGCSNVDGSESDDSDYYTADEGVTIATACYHSESGRRGQRKASNVTIIKTTLDEVELEYLFNRLLVGCVCFVSFLSFIFFLSYFDFGYMS
ncbi:disease resistance protein RUN1-like isoform X2 [Vitis riparia]|uniref:disease resistance protein RUN1-like isoform X2 n=1 Tax=Vitis riparia TaxID=96939 RepID=UPI00155A1EC9|nr:disease resistance protein RUN1-like isoform X2 [Vitis riparia]